MAALCPILWDTWKMKQDELGSAEHSTQGTPTLPAALTCSPLTRHTTYPTPLHSRGLIFYSLPRENLWPQVRMGCPCVLISPRSLAFSQPITQWVSARVSVSAVLRPAIRAQECLKVAGTRGNYSIQSPGSSGEGAPGAWRRQK